MGEALHCHQEIVKRLRNQKPKKGGEASLKIDPLFANEDERKNWNRNKSTLSFKQ